MKVAIIGANGFVGTRLVEFLHLGDHGVCVVPLVRRPSALALACRFELPWRLADALDPVSLEEALKDCEAVVHVALGDPRQIAQMPAVLCAAAAKAGIKRVVYLSSASVHGQAPASGTDENTELQTGQAMEYNDAKVQAERSFFEACQGLKLEGFALRPGVVYGPRSRWIADQANDLREGRAWLYEEGRALINSIYIDNLCHAILQCLRSPASAAGAYLVGDPDTPTWKDFIETVAAHIKTPLDTVHRVGSLPDFRQTRSQQIRSLAASPLSQKLLPMIPGKLKQGVKRLLEPAAPPANAWTLPAKASPRITQELALLQQCHWRLPHAKATERLGYSPAISFKEGLRRSLAWLDFAEGRG